MSIAEKITRAKADLDAVYAAGKKAEYDTFWDGLQDYGNRDSYAYAFVRFSDEMFYPKYDIKPTTAPLIFTRSKINNIKQRLAECGVTLDFSSAAYLNSAFEFCETTQVGIIDTRSATTLDLCFNSATKLVEIEKLILKDDGSQTVNNILIYCHALKHITVEGVIGKNGFSAAQSTLLTKESITSIINALSTTTSGLTVTVSKTAVNKAFETSAGAKDGSTSAEWLALIATTIALSGW